MKRHPVPFSFLLFLLALAAPLAAEGAGGVIFQLVEPALTPRFLGAAAMPYELEFIGGYGYGVTDEGLVIGGFGFGFFDANLVSYDYDWRNEHLAGGVGGMILGQRVFGTRNAHLDIDCRLGLGGAGYWSESAPDGRGYAICYIEPYAELGIGLTPWMQPFGHLRLYADRQPDPRQVLLRTPRLQPDPGLHGQLRRLQEGLTGKTSTESRRRSAKDSPLACGPRTKGR